MLDRIINFSINNKLIISFLTLALVIWGGFGLTRLPIDAVPDITNNQVQIITVAPSQSAQDIERLVTFPVEQAMANIPGLTEIRSFSRFGLSVVTIVFDDHTNVYWARQQVGERLSVAQAQIPAGVGTPELAPVTTGLGEIYQYILRVKPGYEGKYSLMELRTIQDWIVRRQLLGTKGLADVSSFGGHLKQYQIEVNPLRLQAVNLTLSDVIAAIESNNQNTGGAFIERNSSAYFIRSEGLITSLDEIGQVVVSTTTSGAPILVRDIGRITYSPAIRYGAMTENGVGETVGGVVMMLKGANSAQVIANVKTRIDEINPTLPEGVTIEPFLDRTKLVNNAIDTVLTNLAEGALIVIFVLVIMLGNFRAGFVVATVIPLAMLFAVGMMNLFGVSGNLMSLGALDFGLIVDGAVIIVEATLHHMYSMKRTTMLTRNELDSEVRTSASAMMRSAAFGQVIILIVYIPILTLTGIEGKMFLPMAQTVMFAIIGALILSLTYVPVVSTLVLSRNVVHKANFSDKIIAFANRIYAPTLNLALKYKKVVVFTSLGVLVGAGLLFNTLGGEFLPELDEGDFAVETRLLTGTSLSGTIEATLKGEQALLKHFPEVEKIIGKIGASEIPTDPMPLEAADMMVIMKPKDKWTSANSKDEMIEKMQAVLKEEVPGVFFGFQHPIQMRFNELMTGARQDVVLKIYGEDLDSLATYAARIGNLIPSVEGTADHFIERVTGLQQIVVKYNRSNLAMYGISVSEVNKNIQTALSGAHCGFVFEGERRFELVVQFEDGFRNSLDDIRKIRLKSPGGAYVPLEVLASVELVNGPNQIQRDNAKRRIIVGFNIRGRDVESIVTELQGLVKDKIRMAPGYTITYGGSFQNLKEASDRLAIAVPAALILIFVLLYFTFNSLRHGLIIYSAIPLSAIGGIFALWIRGMPFSISAGIGFIALFGVAVLNGIVLISEFNHLRKEDSDLDTIIKAGTSTRLRPVLMTALVASLGFLPMALSHGSGAEVQKPLATVVIGGLITATLLTLVVLPCIYSLVEQWIINKNAYKNEE